MALVRATAHSSEAEKKRAETHTENVHESAAIDSHRDHLRRNSIIPSERVYYGDRLKRSASGALLGPLPKKPRREPTFGSRLEALADRLSKRKPTRYNVQEWKSYRLRSISVLQPYYANSTILKVQFWSLSYFYCS